MKYMNRFSTILALGLVACSPDTPAISSKIDVPDTPGAQQQRDLRGEYTVRFVDGFPPIINIAGHEPTITIGADRIHFHSQCIYADWSYEGQGHTISTQPYYERGSGMCARALAPGETAIQLAFGSLNTVRHIRGGLYVEGGGHRLQLQRKIDKSAIASRAVDLAGSWRVAALDGKDLNKPYGITLIADHEQIWWEPECALQYRAYSIKGSRFNSEPVDLTNLAVCDIGFPEELPRIWSALDAANTISRTAANGVLISGRGRSITLYSQ